MPFAIISTVKSFLIYLFHWYLSYIITVPAVHHPTKLQYPHFELLFEDFAPAHCQKLGTRWRLRVRTKAIMAANSYKKMYGDMETCSNISIMSLRIFGARLETC